MSQKTVFISYRRETGRDFARSIEQALTARGYDVFSSPASSARPEGDRRTMAPGRLARIALEHLTLGRACFYRGTLGGSAPYAAEPKIDQAVDGLRRAGDT